MNLVTMSSKEEADIEKAVLKTARPRTDYEPMQLAKAVLEQQKDLKDLTEDLVLEAIWRLISEGKIKLSSSRKLRVR